MCDSQDSPVELPLDWNVLWKQDYRRRRSASDDLPNYWNRRAPSFARRGQGSPYTEAFLALMAPEPHWSVLDMGCGPGTLAIPLAGLVQRVTAVDFSEVMIERLVQGCAEQGLQNVRAIHGGWEDDWDRAGIGLHDVAIASRSLIVEDLEEALLKLDRSARHRVYLSFQVGDGPRDKGALEALGRKVQKGADYLYVYNLLHQLGIYANVQILKLDDERVFASPEEALEFFQVFIRDLEPTEEVRLRAYLAENLIPKEGVWVLKGRQARDWALIWWEKDTAGI